jgi:hypothetical protein
MPLHERTLKDAPLLPPAELLPTPEPPDFPPSSPATSWSSLSSLPATPTRSVHSKSIPAALSVQAEGENSRIHIPLQSPLTETYLSPEQKRVRADALSSFSPPQIGDDYNGVIYELPKPKYRRRKRGEQSANRGQRTSSNCDLQKDREK